MLNTPLAPDTRASLDARGGLMQKSTVSSQGSEDGDALSSVSAQGTRPSVVGLRDRLLREARSERQRCLEVAEAADRRRSELRGASNASVQTDPVVFYDDNAAGVAGSKATAHWSNADEQAQAEALRTIQMLADRGHTSRSVESRIAQLEEEIRAERASCQELDAQANHERSRKEAAQQQVLCLEYELDGKEAALQVAERALERRDADLQAAQQQLRALQESAQFASASSSFGDEARFKAMRAQLLERERQLELKDQHISRLLNVLRQHRTGFAEEDYSTMCGSERSMTMSTVTTAA